VSILKISLSNWIFYESSLDENLSTVKKLGFENLEFSMKCIKNQESKVVYTVKKLLDFYDLNCLTVHSACLYINNEKELQSAISVGKASLDVASILCAKTLVVHSFISKAACENTRKMLLLQIFGELGRYSTDIGVKLALENLSLKSQGFGKSLPEVEELFAIVNNKNIGMTFDFCHSETLNQTDCLFKTFNKRILNVHLSNIDHGPFFEPSLNLRNFLDSLSVLGYDGPLTIELRPGYSITEITSTKAALEKSLRN
jgi:sugar phosphate isomerase/epimerase